MEVTENNDKNLQTDEQLESVSGGVTYQKKCSKGATGFGVGPCIAYVSPTKVVPKCSNCPF